MNRRKSLRLAPLGFALLAQACAAASPEDPAHDEQNLSSTGTPIVGLAGKCVDDDGDGTADGNRIQLYDCNGGDAQAWTYTNGTFVGPAGKCLDVQDNAQRSGTPVWLYTCNGTTAQQWTEKGATLVSAGGFCLDVTGANSANRTQLEIWDCNGGTNQMWSTGSSSGGGGGTSGGGGVVPVANGVAPFGYGVVQQVLSDGAGLTGAASCVASFGSGWSCLSVSGGSACAYPVAAGALVSCSQAAANTVDESPFLPPGSCSSPSLTPGEQGWCAGSDYLSTRQRGTLYLYDDYVRIGVSTDAGGTIYELYGTDKQNRILQNGGGAVQMSLYADTGIGTDPSDMAWFVISNSDTACDPTGYPDQGTCLAHAAGGGCQYGVNLDNVTNCTSVFACADNGQSPGSGINPIQAAAPDCYATSAANDVDSVSSPGAGQVDVVKINPWQDSKSDALTGLTWGETVSVFGPYAKTTFHLAYSGSITAPISFQEMPAVFGREGASGGLLFFYDGASPYTNDAAVQRLDGPKGFGLGGVGLTMRLPGRQGPFPDGAPDYSLSEEWVSDCDSSGVHCLTIASFDASEKNMIIQGVAPAAGYQGLHGYFALHPGLDESYQMYFFPYRFDQVVQGLTIRQWIANLKSGAPNPAANAPASAAPPAPTNAYPAQQAFDGGQLVLYSNDSVVQVNGLTLVFQPDGNLVAYDANQAVAWSSGSASSCAHAACTANFQPDGNLVLYNSATGPFWSSNSGVAGRSTLTVSGTAPYLTVKNAQNGVVWASH